MVLVTAGNFSLPRRRLPRAGCTCQELDLTAITRLIRNTGSHKEGCSDDAVFGSL